MPFKDRPAPLDQGGRSSVPPSSHGAPSPAPSTPTSTAPTPPKPAKTGPATFEQMGIPQGKQDDDCVSRHVDYDKKIEWVWALALALALAFSTHITKESIEPLTTRSALDVLRGLWKKETETQSPDLLGIAQI
ncbi:hypothetical protein O1611_g7248 [Lasiodiplodia mahajangana]|uniref:Uncharacterized protein n=1 Tax=Lasiodiplodia mahajangana TaxID=1108764 RepID=A0ACC2JFZ6_9PEZI|nr:hypothetical protein O1611_g7248 [Lasiodiplodia mahajangana]